MLDDKNRFSLTLNCLNFENIFEISCGLSEKRFLTDLCVMASSSFSLFVNIKS